MPGACTGTLYSSSYGFTNGINVSNILFYY